MEAEAEVQAGAGAARVRAGVVGVDCLAGRCKHGDEDECNTDSMVGIGSTVKGWRDRKRVDECKWTRKKKIKRNAAEIKK